MYPLKLADYPAAIRNRARIERRIIVSLVRELLAEVDANGAPLFTLAIDDGEQLHPKTRDDQALWRALINTDEDQLVVYYRVGGQLMRCGAVQLVYGNDGWNVIADYSIGLEKSILKTLALAKSLEPR